MGYGRKMYGLCGWSRRTLDEVPEMNGTFDWLMSGMTGRVAPLVEPITSAKTWSWKISRRTAASASWGDPLSS